LSGFITENISEYLIETGNQP